MAFPETPLGVTTELGIGGVMTDVTPHALTRDIITHTRGQDAEGQEADPASCSLTLKSPDGLYAPRNPLSPYFEQIGLNTPMQVSVHAGSPGLAVNGAIGDHASTPDTGVLDITGDIDLRLDATLTNWTDATDAFDTTELLGKLNLAAGTKSWVLGIRANKVYFEWSADGTATLSASSTLELPHTPSGRQAIRVTLDVDNGASGRTVTFYTAPTMAGTWTMLGSAVVQAGTTSIFNSTTNVKVGDATDASFTRPVGRFHAAEIRNGIGGTVVANPDFTAQAIGATSFVDGAGRTWTVNGTASISNKQTRFVGEFSDWPSEWAGRGDLITVAGDGVGILERMNQGRKALASTLRRRIPSYNPVAYWPMEEGSDATTVYSPLTSVQSFTPTGLDFAADDSLPGSQPLPVVQVGASFAAKVPTVAAGTWQMELVYNLDAMPVATTTLFEVRTTGTCRRVRARVATNAVTIDGLDADDATVFTQTASPSTQFTGAWTRLQIRAVQSGGNVTYSVRWIVIGGAGFSTSTTIAASPGAVTEVRSEFGTGLDGLRFGHLAVFNFQSDFPFNSADQGFNGETAGARMVRLCEEEGVRFRFAGTASDTMPMGPQRPSTLLALLQECAEADGGIFGEERDRLGLRYRARTTLYNQTPALTLPYGTRGILLGKPVDDTSNVRNDVTVSRVAGGSGRAVLEEGRLSVQDPPNGVGLYDESVDINLASDALAEPSAYWRMHLGTWDEARYPSLTVQLHRVPSLIDTALSLTEGDLIRITDLPSFLPPGPIDLLVQGYTERLGMYTWEIDLVCVPAGPYTVGVLSDPALEWADADGSELAAAATSTATTLDLLTTAGLVWWTDPADTPYALSVGGEEVQVAAGGRLINTNPFLENGISGWSGGSGSTVALSTAIVHPQAEGSILVTPNGSGDANAVNTLTPVGSVAPGVNYVASMWVYSPGGYTDIRPIINWYNSAGTYLSTTSGPSAMPVPAGVWTHLKQTLTAPANASRASVLANERDTPAAGDIFYAWAIRITQPKPSWLHDTFSRTVSSDWGTSDAGLAWNRVGGGSASDYNVGSGYGSHILSTLDTSRRSAVAAPHADFDIYCDITTSALATGTESLYGAITARMLDSSNMYMARLQFTPANTVVLVVRKVIADVGTDLGTYTVPVTHVAGTYIRVRFQGVGTALKAKAWLASTAEPSAWAIEAADSAITAANQYGTRSIKPTGNTNGATVEVRYDNYEVVNPQVMTVERSRNGIVKAQSAGTDVRLAHPTHVAL